MKLAFYTYSYIDRSDLDLVPVLETVAAAGYAGLDVSATWRADLDPALMPAEVRRTYRETAARLGLKIEAAVTHLPLVNALWDGQPINLPGAVDVAVDVGAAGVTVHLGGPGHTGRSEAEAWDTAVAALREAAAYAGERGRWLACDAVFPGCLTDTPDKVLRLVEDVGSPHFGHNYDPCYLAASGFDPAEAARTLREVIRHAHVKDKRGNFPQFDHLIPGEGEIDHAAWLSALAETGFIGYLAVECFPSHPLERACAVAYRTLRPLLE
jgi:sugar phosphate isomerase/epimerase